MGLEAADLSEFIFGSEIIIKQTQNRPYGIRREPAIGHGIAQRIIFDRSSCWSNPSTVWIMLALFEDLIL